MIEHLPNEEVTIGLLPLVDDEQGIGRFASTFNGYEYYGSLKASGEAAQASQRGTLTDLRNELFFSWRASRHGVGNEFVAKYKELYPCFTKVLGAKHGHNT